MTPDVTWQLAAFAARPPSLDPDGSVCQAGRRATANAVGVGIGGSRSDAAGQAFAVATSLGTSKLCSLLGRDEHLSPTWAAFVNAVAMRADEYDDIDLGTLVHPGAPVVAAALAVGELTHATGSRVLEAVILGIEVAVRVARCLGPGHTERGWDGTGTAGHLGATAAAGRLFELDPAHMASALGIAATQAAGLGAAMGTMTGPLHAGKAAANAVEGSLLARRGFTGPRAGIEGRRGFGQAASPNPDYTAALADLGERWHIEDSTFNRYACGTLAHPAVDAALALRRHLENGGELIAAELKVNPLALDMMGIRNPSNGLESKFSLSHCVAVALVDGRAGPEQFATERALDPVVGQVRLKVQARPDGRIARDQARLEIVLEDSRTYAHAVMGPSGGPARRLTDAELVRRATDSARPVLGERAGRPVELAFTIDRLASVRELLASGSPR